MITYLKGDASNPSIELTKFNFIAHVCNNIGKWGSGFVLSLNKHSLNPRRVYQEQYGVYYSNQENFLGSFHVADYINSIKVVNMIAMNGVKSIDNPKPINYFALKLAMDCSANYLYDLYNNNLVIHSPKFGSGLAGGDWNIIEGYINNFWKNFDVRIYEL